MVTFVNSYSYNRPFDGSHNVKVALSENEFDTPDLEGLKTLERVAMIVNTHTTYVNIQVSTLSMKLMFNLFFECIF